MTRILRVPDAALAAFAVRAGSSIAERRRFGAELDAAADVLVLGDVTGPAPDRTAAAGALLAITRGLVVVPIIAERQHPVNLARVGATLSNLHGRRLGLAGTDRSLLALVSRLWETWPLDAVIGDADAGVYVDDARILRITDPAHPLIGGPLTLPVDVHDKPVTVLLSASDAVRSGVDVVVDPAALPVWGSGDEAGPGLGGADARGARAVFGLGPSTLIATGTPAFEGDGRLDQV